MFNIDVDDVGGGDGDEGADGDEDDVRERRGEERARMIKQCGLFFCTKQSIGRIYQASHWWSIDASLIIDFWCDRREGLVAVVRVTLQLLFGNWHMAILNPCFAIQCYASTKYGTCILKQPTQFYIQLYFSVFECICVCLVWSLLDVQLLAFSCIGWELTSGRKVGGVGWGWGGFYVVDTRGGEPDVLW